MPDRGFSHNEMFQPVHFRVRATNDDVPIPVVVANFLLHLVCRRGEDSAAQEEPLLVDRRSHHTTDVVIVPVDVTFDRSIAMQDEAITLGGP